MRHTDIKTTMKHYVSLAADDVAAELWGKMQPRIDTFVDTSPKPAKFDAETEPQETTKPVDTQRVRVGS